MNSAVRKFKNVYHLLQSHLWRAVYRWPDRGLRVYGVTGTNGKTTTCHLLASILCEGRGADHVGMLTTIALWVGRNVIVNETKMTTLPSRMVWRYLRQMADAGITDVVLELTSHALDQHRLAGIRLDGGIILNIAREHLDYHQTMEAYWLAKAKIVAYLRPNAPLVVNKQFLSFFNSLKSRQANHSHFSTTRLIEFSAHDARAVQTALVGDVNKENVLAARLLAAALGISQAVIDQGVAQVKYVPGRMEWIGLDRDAARLPKVLVDYAVTPDALERLYADLKQQLQGEGKLFAVLGAAGLRDRGKRPAMARAAAQYADEVVLTREDPWTESEEQIFADLEVGMVDASVPWSRIVDRREAIWHCLQKAQPADIVVVTGKGAETGMAVGSTVIPWSDKKVIQELLLKRLTMHDQ